MFYGIKTGFNEAFEITSEQYKAIVRRSPKSAILMKPFLGGQDIRRYYVEWDGRYLIVVPAGWTRQTMLASKKFSGLLSEKQVWQWFSRRFQGIAKHLARYEAACRKRQDQGEFWWELRPCGYYSVLDCPKLIFPDICKDPRFFLDRDGIYVSNTAYLFGVGDPYLLGILNSRLCWFAISNISIPFGIRGGQYRYRLFDQYMGKVPIRPINFSDPADKARHDKMVALVERMLELNKKKHSGKLAPSELDRVEREIAATDAEIDNLVYEVYGITQQERKIIERR
jgi:hypothetical protein